MPRFVILEHDWPAVHWDLMLERQMGWPLPTWAIDAPIASGVDLPARRLSDHRSIYLDYEGLVSGDRGLVKRWDTGDYHVVVWEDGVRVVIELEGKRLAGRAELWVEGAGTLQRIEPWRMHYRPRG